MIFHDRADAGRQLGLALKVLVAKSEIVVLGIPRGGVIVASQVARALDAPLDICVAHKIGAPGNPEFAIGSVAAEGEPFIDEKITHAFRFPVSYLKAEIDEQRREIFRRITLYRGGRPEISLEGKTVILVDDGIATGATVSAALGFLSHRAATRIVLAAPVGAVEVCGRLSRLTDQVVVLDTPENFRAVGEFYRDFGQVTDNEVIIALATAKQTP